MATQTVAHDVVPFRFVSDAHAGRLDLSLHGELDLATSDLISRLDAESDADVREVVVDVTDLDFIDTMGVRALLDVQSRNRGRGRTVEMINPTALVRRVITLFGREDLLAPST